MLWGLNDCTFACAKENDKSSKYCPSILITDDLSDFMLCGFTGIDASFYDQFYCYLLCDFFAGSFKSLSNVF